MICHLQAGDSGEPLMWGQAKSQGLRPENEENGYVLIWVEEKTSVPALKPSNRENEFFLFYSGLQWIVWGPFTLGMTICFFLFIYSSRVLHTNKEYIAIKIQRGPSRHCASIWVVWGARCNNLSFTLRGISQHAPCGSNGWICRVDDYLTELKLPIWTPLHHSHNNMCEVPISYGSLLPFRYLKHVCKHV